MCYISSRFEDEIQYILLEETTGVHLNCLFAVKITRRDAK